MRIMEKMTMTITPVNRCVVLQFTNITPIHPEKGCAVKQNSPVVIKLVQRHPGGGKLLTEKEKCRKSPLGS